jgi:hypothetical protein
LWAHRPIQLEATEWPAKNPAVRIAMPAMISGSEDTFVSASPRAANAIAAGSTARRPILSANRPA